MTGGQVGTETRRRRRLTAFLFGPTAVLVAVYWAWSASGGDSVTVGIAAAAAVTGAFVLWLLLPGITERDAHIAAARRLRPVETRRGTRYRLQPDSVWMFRAIGVVTVVFGAWLTLSAGPIGLVFLGFGAILGYAAIGSTVWIDDTHLRAQARFRRRSWALTDIKSVSAVDGLTSGRVRVPVIQLQIETLDGSVFKASALSDSVKPANLVSQLVPIIEQRVESVRVPEPKPPHLRDDV